VVGEVGAHAGEELRPAARFVEVGEERAVEVEDVHLAGEAFASSAGVGAANSELDRGDAYGCKNYLRLIVEHRFAPNTSHNSLPQPGCSSSSTRSLPYSRTAEGSPSTGLLSWCGDPPPTTTGGRGSRARLMSPSSADSASPPQQGSQALARAHRAACSLRPRPRRTVRAGAAD
jgi:hypothetical protein